MFYVSIELGSFQTHQLLGFAQHHGEMEDRVLTPISQIEKSRLREQVEFLRLLSWSMWKLGGCHI